MAPSNPHVISHFRQLIYYHLDCNLLRNALFIAGRLHAYESRSTEAAYLLALCHLRLGQLKAAYDCSRNAGSRGTHLGCSYVFAQACLGLEKYMEGATALERSKGLWSVRNSWGKHSDTRRQHLPDAAAVYCLLGKLHQAHSDNQRAIEFYAESLKVNPFMWDAYTSLCDLGANVRTQNIFKMTSEMRTMMADVSLDQSSFGIFDESPPNALTHSKTNSNIQNQQPSTNDPFTNLKNKSNTDKGSSALFEKMHNTIMTPIAGPDIAVDETPTNHGSGMDIESIRGETVTEPPLAPIRKGKGLPGMGLDFNHDAPPKMRQNATMRSKSRSNLHSEEHEDSTNKPQPATNHAELKRTVSGKTAYQNAGPATKANTASAVDASAPQQRKSVRLLNQLRPQSGKFAYPSSIGSVREDRELRKAKAPSTKNRSTNSFNVGRVVSGNRKVDPMDADNKEQRPPSNTSATAQAAAQKPQSSERSREIEALQWLFSLFSTLGHGYFALSHYQCQDAIRIFQSLVPSQRETAWVLSQIGRAYYEQSAYAEAEKIFHRIRLLAPSRIEDMEFFSTSLWHLKRDVDLAFLAHELIDQDRCSPQAWCAVGNSFALQREHDQALKCFRRATQLDPSFAYAHTLQGHEYISNEEYDKAMSAFRAAITTEKRHYNAWYGLGQVFERQGRYAIAEHHYRTAQSINPSNAVLVTCTGSVLEKQKNLKAALVKYSEACQLAERGTLWRFKKAKVLVALGQPERALSELRILKDLAPDDANVHFMLGTVHKKLRQKPEAIRHFTTALNLDPKASHHIKEAMEELDHESDEDVEM